MSCVSHTEPRHHADHEPHGDDHEHGDNHPHSHAHEHNHPHGHGHSHNHNHDHSSPIDAVRHFFSHAFGQHSHSPADQVDSALEGSMDGRRALIISFIVLLITALLQIAVVFTSHSAALLGDALHNVVDATTAIPLLIAFRLALRKPNRTFTHGFGRAEDLAGIFVVAMIALSALAAGYESFRRLLHPEPMSHLGAVAVAAIIGFIGNEWVARYRIRVGRRIGSAALVADGLHARTDGFTSLAVLIGVGGTLLGFPIADPVVGIVIAIAICGVLRQAIKEVGGRIMDAIDPALTTKAEDAVNAVPEATAIRVGLRWIGHTTDATVVASIPPSLGSAESESVRRHIHDHLRTTLPNLASCTIELRPAEPSLV